MNRRINISASIASRWSLLTTLVRNHDIWNLPEQFQPEIHIRAKQGQGVSFTSFYIIHQLQLVQHRAISTANYWRETSTQEDRTIAILDQHHELGLFAQAISSESSECDPHNLLNNDDASCQPWSMLMPLPMRRMIEVGVAHKEANHFVINAGRTDPASYKINYCEKIHTHRQIELFEYDTKNYRYFYGKSLHYLKIFNCQLPVTTKKSLEHGLLSQIVDDPIFHHADLTTIKIEQHKKDLVLHLPRSLTPSARPPL